MEAEIQQAGRALALQGLSELFAAIAFYEENGLYPEEHVVHARRAHPAQLLFSWLRLLAM
jgi:hypothetical protein